MFDPRLISVEPFVPHDLPTLQRAYPKGAISEAIHENTAKRFARVEDVTISRIRYRVDDHEVTGAMLEPVGWQPGKHPILIFNRGGNGEYGIVAVPLILRYMLPFAQQGYLVFASNYRGNDGGSGEEEFGGAEIADVTTLLDIASHHPGFDGKNRFMLGASRGGMMTYLAIKHGAALNAAATFGGVSDVRATIAHRPEMKLKVYAKRIPDFEANCEAAYDARSAVQWPETLKSVPLLIAHGSADDVVLPEQSQKLAAALASVNASHRLVIYENGNHPLSTHVDAWIQEIMNWFTAHSAA